MELYCKIIIEYMFQMYANILVRQNQYLNY